MRKKVFPIFLMILGMFLVIITPIATQAYNQVYGIDCLIWGIASAFLGLVWLGVLSLNTTANTNTTEVVGA